MNAGIPLAGLPAPDPVRVTIPEAFESHAVELEGAPEALAAARLGAPVAAALMAALDWMGGESGSRRGFRARLDDTCLEVGGWPGDLRGLRAAGEILALVGGNLHPAPAAEGARGLWRLRVPLAAEPAAYLMVEQGGLEVAFPWPAVLAVVMAPRSEVESASLGAPVLPRLGAATEAQAEIPVVLIGHGLRRAYFAADRLIWRLRAETLPPTAVPPASGLVHALAASDGATYWLADPALLLARIEPLPIPEEALPHPEARAPAVPSPAPAPPAARPAPAVFELGPESVEPLLVPPAAPHPEAPVATSRPAAARPAGVRHALVAEDSFIARVFLVRMLEHRGFAVTAAASAAELLALLPRLPWVLVCADVELGDAGGAPLLRQVRETLVRVAATETRGPSAAPPLVALVRDARDIAAARTAGVALTLLKPYDVDAFEALLAGLDLAR